MVYVLKKTWRTLQVWLVFRDKISDNEEWLLKGEVTRHLAKQGCSFVINGGNYNFWRYLGLLVEAGVLTSRGERPTTQWSLTERGRRLSHLISDVSYNDEIDYQIVHLKELMKIIPGTLKDVKAEDSSTQENDEQQTSVDTAYAITNTVDGGSSESMVEDSFVIHGFTCTSAPVESLPRDDDDGYIINHIQPADVVVESSIEPSIQDSFETYDEIYAELMKMLQTSQSHPPSESETSSVITEEKQ